MRWDSTASIVGRGGINDQRAQSERELHGESFIDAVLGVMDRQLAAVQHDDDKDSVVNRKSRRSPSRRSAPLDGSSRNHDKRTGDISENGPVRKVIGHWLTGIEFFKRQ